MPPSNGSSRLSAADRYEQAATETLEMLDWCIGYFTATHKDSIASRLASNRRYIKERLMREPAQPLPASKS